MSDIVLVSPPDISTAELLFNEDETRNSLHPFYIAATITTYWSVA